MNFSNRSVIAALAIVAAITPATLEAQACLGLPQRSSIAFESAEYSVGKSNGIVGSLAGGRTALGLAFRARDINDDISGFEGAGRFSVVIPISRFQICPGIGLGYIRDKWDVDSDVTLTENRLSALAGAGFGIEQTVYKDLSVIPFLGVYYEFTGILFDVDAPDSENDYSGDTLSHVRIDYGVMARFRFLFGGIAATRYSDTGDRPVGARALLGLTFSGGGSNSSRATPSRRRNR